MNCTLCCNSSEWLVVSRFCSKCQKIKHLLNLYGEEVYSTLEEVLVRTPDQQSNKIKTSAPVHNHVKNQTSLYAF